MAVATAFAKKPTWPTSDQRNDPRRREKRANTTEHDPGPVHISTDLRLTTRLGGRQFNRDPTFSEGT